MGPRKSDDSWRLVMAQRVSPDGAVEAEPVVRMPVGQGKTLVLDDGTELRFDADGWAELTEDAA